MLPYLFALALQFAAQTPPAPAPAPPGVVQVVRDRAAGYALSAREASLEEIGRELQRVTRCRLEVKGKLRDLRLSLQLSPRPPERIYRTLARRAAAAMTVAYRFERVASDRAATGPTTFAQAPVVLVVERAEPVQDVLRRLELPVELEEGLRGSVRVVALRHPLRYALDRIAAQLSARWLPVVRLEARQPFDAEDAETDRMLRHLSDLAELPSRERREEIEAELDHLERLPPDDQAAGVRQLASDVLSLAGVLASTPGEHREDTQGDVLAVARDYGAVLGGLAGARRERFQPVIRALSELKNRLESIR